jgi:hypothetical protein
MANVNGFPGIVFYNSDGSTLDFVRAQNVSGSAWDTPIQLANGTINNESIAKLIIGPGSIPMALGYLGTGTVFRRIRRCCSGVAPRLVRCGSTR